MSEFSRAFGLMDRLDDLTAERLEPTPFGPVLVHTRFNRVHDLNFLRADEPGDATAEELAAEAEETRNEPHGTTDLYCEDGVGQVENVATLPEYRGRGLARSVVLRAVAESHAAGNNLTFLVADTGDWPRQLYEKLGFETFGRYARFFKPV